MNRAMQTIDMGGVHAARGSGLQDGEVLASHASPGGGPAVRVRALRPTLHPELADAFEAANREALRRHAVEGIISQGCPLRARAATWLIVAERPGHGGACMAGIRLDLRTPAQSPSSSPPNPRRSPRPRPPWGEGRVARSSRAVQLRRSWDSLRDVGAGRPVSRVVGYGNGGLASA